MVQLRVAFIENQLALRGTQNTLWSLAHFNETMLGNKSIVISRVSKDYRDDDTTEESIAHFTNRFETHFVPMNEVDAFLQENKIDVAYVPTAGDMSTIPHIPRSIPTISHCVFSNQNCAATVQTAISPYIAGGRCHVLNNVIHVDANVSDGNDLRTELGIPENAVVFGRYGGFHTFNISYAIQAVLTFAEQNPHIYFLFMNTKKFGPDLPNVIFLKGTRDNTYKTRFIRTCDAMIHARADGETFGMAVGEFAVLGRPIITAVAGPMAHLEYLNGDACVYKNPTELMMFLKHFKKGQTLGKTKYDQCLPEYVIPFFAELLKEAITKWNVSAR